jgi:hypothetical protein
MPQWLRSTLAIVYVGVYATAGCWLAAALAGRGSGAASPVAA